MNTGLRRDNDDLQVPETPGRGRREDPGGGTHRTPSRLVRSMAGTGGGDRCKLA